MIPSRRIGIVAALALFALSACATGPNFYSNQPPVIVTAAQIMKAKTCSDLPTDQYGGANPMGWARKAPAGMDSITCGSKYASGAFYCADPSQCQELSWGTTPADPADRGKTRHAIVDVVEGMVTACAAPDVYFGRAGYECKPQTLTGPIRGVFDVTVPPLSPGGGDQNSVGIHVGVKPAGTAKIVIGQIGFAELSGQP